jgi:hypothetical protein
MIMQASAFMHDSSQKLGFVSALLDISSDPNQHAQLRLIASTQLGTMVETHWKY